MQAKNPLIQGGLRLCLENEENVQQTLGDGKEKPGITQVAEKVALLVVHIYFGESISFSNWRKYGDLRYVRYKGPESDLSFTGW